MASLIGLRPRAKQRRRDAAYHVIIVAGSQHSLPSAAAAALAARIVEPIAAGAPGRRRQNVRGRSGRAI